MTIKLSKSIFTTLEKDFVYLSKKDEKYVDRHMYFILEY